MQQPSITPRPRLTLLVVVALVLVVLVANRFLPIGQATIDVVDYLRARGFVGALIFFLVYVLAAVALLPGSILTLGAGFAYGPLWGAALVVPASMAGAVLGFALARTRLRPWVETWVRTMPRFAELDRSIAHDGFRIVVLLRLSPLVPYSVLNYLLGLTTIRWPSFVLASFLGMLPGTLMYTYMGSAVPNLGAMSTGIADSGAGQIFFWTGLVATAAVSLVLGRRARRALAALPPVEE